MRINLSQANAQKLRELLPGRDQITQLDEGQYIELGPIGIIGLFHYANSGEVIEDAFIRSIAQSVKLEPPKEWTPSEKAKACVESLARATTCAREHGEEVHIVVLANNGQGITFGSGSEAGTLSAAIILLTAVEPCEHILMAMEAISEHLKVERRDEAEATQTKETLQ